MSNPNDLREGYSNFIRPLFIIIDIVIINTTLLFIGNPDYVNIVYLNFMWILCAYYTGFYKIYRITTGLRVLSLVISQFFIFTAIFFAFFALIKTNLVVKDQQLGLILISILIITVKYLLFYLLKFYRGLGLNYRKVVLIGHDSTTLKIADFFLSKESYGFRNLGFFSNTKSNRKSYLGNISDSFNFILENEVDEIYCSTSTLDKNEIKKVISFGNLHNKRVNLIPDIKDIYGKNLRVEYYGTIPILKKEILPFERAEVRLLKRVFDFLFSITVCLTILSWLIPILWIIIKLDSKGPLFFVQKRAGINGENFKCYKFRSMKRNNFSDEKQVSYKDERITKVGAILRKTSLDELPQFINVLLGDMSVIGPRPHMNKQSLKFEKEIDNYIKRNAVKPGITGLAQVSGYRGEIKRKSDIENRVRLDVFYIENWSFFLDMKIIFKTIINLFFGDDKAY